MVKVSTIVMLAVSLTLALSSCSDNPKDKRYVDHTWKTADGCIHSRTDFECDDPDGCAVPRRMYVKSYSGTEEVSCVYSTGSVTVRHY